MLKNAHYRGFKMEPHKQGTEFSKSCTDTLFDLSDFGKKRVEVKFTLEETFNDRGLLLLKEVDNQIGLTDRLSGCIKDDRHQGYVKHSIGSMLRQRIMQIAAGYEGNNDCNALKDDGILKICANRQQSLATQSTMCRFENLCPFNRLFCYKSVRIQLQVYHNGYD